MFSWIGRKRWLPFHGRKLSKKGSGNKWLPPQSKTRRGIPLFSLQWWPRSKGHLHCVSCISLHLVRQLPASKEPSEQSDRISIFKKQVFGIWCAFKLIWSFLSLQNYTFLGWTCMKRQGIFSFDHMLKNRKCWPLRHCCSSKGLIKINVAGWSQSDNRWVNSFGYLLL